MDEITKLKAELSDAKETIELYEGMKEGFEQRLADIISELNTCHKKQDEVSRMLRSQLNNISPSLLVIKECIWKLR